MEQIATAIYKGASGGSAVKTRPVMQEARLQALDQEDPLGRAWPPTPVSLSEIPWTEDLGRYLSK